MTPNPAPPTSLQAPVTLQVAQGGPLAPSLKQGMYGRLVDVLPDAFEVLLLILVLGAAQKLLALWIGESQTFLDQWWLKVKYFFDIGDIIVLGRFLWKSLRR